MTALLRSQWRKAAATLTTYYRGVRLDVGRIFGNGDLLDPMREAWVARDWSRYLSLLLEALKREEGGVGQWWAPINPQYPDSAWRTGDAYGGNTYEPQSWHGDRWQVGMILEAQIDPSLAYQHTQFPKGTPLLITGVWVKPDGEPYLNILPAPIRVPA